MNLLENFVNKFSTEQKTLNFNLNDENCRNNNGYCNNLISKQTINTKSTLMHATINNTINNGTSQEDVCFSLSNSTNFDNYNNNSNFIGDHNRQIDANGNNSIFMSNMNSCSSSSLIDNNNQLMQNSIKKGMRNMFSYNQIEILENIFEQTHYPDSTMREKLSAHLGINSSRIQVWFQNRRAKFRKFDLKNKKLNNNNNNTVKFNQHEELLNFSRKLNDSYEKDTNKINRNVENSSNSYPPSSSVSMTTPSNSAYCSDLIINGTYSNFLKNISTTQFTSITPNPQCIQTPLNDGYYNTENNNTQNLVNNNNNYAFVSEDLHQKEFDRIQTLYPNSSYQIYSHYQQDDF